MLDMSKEVYIVSYSESEDGAQTFYNPDTTEAKYFHISQTAFEIEFLNQLSMQLALVLVAFESHAEVYNGLHSSADVIRLKALQEKGHSSPDFLTSRFVAC